MESCPLEWFSKCVVQYVRTREALPTSLKISEPRIMPPILPLFRRVWHARAPLDLSYANEVKMASDNSSGSHDPRLLYPDMDGQEERDPGPREESVGGATSQCRLGFRQKFGEILRE